MMKRYLIVVCAAFLIVACSAGFDPSRGAEYTANAWLVVKSRPPAIQASAEREFSEKEFEIYKNTQRLLLKSRYVLMAALRKPETAKIPDVQTERRKGDPVRWLSGQIKVEFPDNAEIMTVSCTRNDPEEAQVLLKSVVDAYMAEVVNFERDLKREKFSDLEQVLSFYEQNIRSKMEVIRQLTADSPGDDDEKKSERPTVDVEMLQLEIKTLKRLITDVRLELERQKIELRARPRISLLGPVEEPLMPD